MIVKPDVQGAASIRRRVPQAVLIYVAPGDESELTRRAEAARLGDRARPSPPGSNGMRHELEVGVHFDYVVVNRDGRVEQAVEDLRGIITAERLRVRPRLCQVRLDP